MNIGLFFGSFNPVHCGHLMIANYCLAYTDLQEVWMVVSPHNPSKDRDSLFPQEKRLQWLQQAVSRLPLPIKACDAELRLPQPSYTIATLEYLSGSEPNHRFSVIMGADNIASIESWKEWQRILTQYRIMVYPRTGFDAQALCARYGAVCVDAPLLEISSTMLRNALAEGRNLAAFVPSGVDIFERQYCEQNEWE